MPRKLHVGNLSHMVLKSELQGLFASHGAVRNIELTSLLKTANARASALVEMDSDALGEAAIAGLNGTSYRGELMTVAWATTRQGKGVDLSRMFESMNIPDAGEGNGSRGPH
jgi:hypothetical protein